MIKKIYLILILLVLLTSALYSASYRGQLIAEGEKITIDFKQVELLDVIRIIGRKFDINLIAGDKINGNVTVTFKDVLVDDALETILSINGYTYVKIGNIIKVVTEKEAEELIGKPISQIEEEIKRLNLINKVVGLKYADPRFVASVLKENLGVNASITVNERRNTIIARIPQREEELFDFYINELDRESITLDDDEVADFEIDDREIRTEIFKVKYLEPNELKEIIIELKPKYEENIRVNSTLKSLVVEGNSDAIIVVGSLVEDFDLPPLQVKIEAKVIEVKNIDTEETGLDWIFGLKGNTSGNIIEIEQGGQKYSDDGLSIGKDQDYGFGLKYGLLDSNSFEVAMQALMKMTNVDILQTPNITTLNRKKASINIVEKRSIITSYDENGNPQKSEKQAGTNLEVTPFIDEQGKINLELVPEISSFGTSSDTVDSTKINTNVIISDNETLAIGGLVKSEVSNDIKAVPILGDLPFVGKLFQKKIVSENKRDLILFITPTVIQTRPFMNNYKVKSDKEIILESMKKAEEKEDKESKN